MGAQDYQVLFLDLLYFMQVAAAVEHLPEEQQALEVLAEAVMLVQQVVITQEYQVLQTQAVVVVVVHTKVHILPQVAQAAQALLSFVM
jgi:hypothetical protein